MGWAGLDPSGFANCCPDPVRPLAVRDVGFRCARAVWGTRVRREVLASGAKSPEPGCEVSVRCLVGLAAGRHRPARPRADDVALPTGRSGGAQRGGSSMSSARGGVARLDLGPGVVGLGAVGLGTVGLGGADAVAGRDLVHNVCPERQRRCRRRRPDVSRVPAGIAGRPGRTHQVVSACSDTDHREPARDPHDSDGASRPSRTGAGVTWGGATSSLRWGEPRRGGGGKSKRQGAEWSDEAERAAHSSEVACAKIRAVRPRRLPRRGRAGATTPAGDRRNPRAVGETVDPIAPGCQRARAGRGAGRGCGSSWGLSLVRARVRVRL